MTDANPSRLSAFRTFISDFIGYDPVALVRLSALMVARSLSEGITYLMLVPLLAAIGVVSTDNGGETVGAALAGLENLLGSRPSVEFVLAVFILAISARAVLGWATSRASARFMTGFVQHVRTNLFLALSRASWLHLATSKQAQNTYALTMQAETLESAAHSAISVASNALTVAAGTAVALLLSPHLTLLVLTAGAVIGGALYAYQRRAYARGDAVAKAMQALFDILIARLNGLKLAKAFAIERPLERDFVASANAYRTRLVELQDDYALAQLWQELGAAMVLALFVYSAVTVFAASSLELVMLIAIFSRLLPMVLSVQSNLQSLAGLLPDYAAIKSIERAARAAEEPTPEVLEPIAIRHQIELRGVSFRYPGEVRDWTLDDVRLTLPAGKSVGLVGLSGAGKSTLADILSGLIQPSRGDVVVDGKAIDSDRRPHWRASVTYLPQDAPMFHDTLRANLTVGARGALDADIWRALEMTKAADLVRAMPDGLETMAGDRGVRLSGGERQRLMLASALLRRPRLLILDEATSALNPVDERRIVEGLASLAGNTTIFMIAHRISSIAWTDYLALLEGGRIRDFAATETILSRPDGLLRGMMTAHNGEAAP